MNRTVIAIAVLLAAGAASAQPAPQASAPPPPPPGSPPPPRPQPGLFQGAFIKISRPDISLSVRCAEGDTTRACGEIVAQMIEKLAAMPAPDRGPERGGYRERDRPRGGPRDRDRDEERPRDRD